MKTHHGSALLLVSRPTGLPTASDFRMEKIEISEVPDGHVLLENLWLSIEPYMMLSMRGAIPMPKRIDGNRLDRLSDLYVSGVEVGSVMCGPTIARVLESRRSDLRIGDLVVAYGGWQTILVDDGSVLAKITDDVPVTSHLGVLGIPGFTAYGGMQRVAKVRKGETVVVSAAFGPVGSVAGQMARLAGGRAVGVASGEEKCRMLTEELGFDAAVDRLLQDFPARLQAACPNGIDVYFENVGGAVWEAVMPLLNQHARVRASTYLPASYRHTARALVPPRRPAIDVFEALQYKRIHICGISVFDHIDLESDFYRDIGGHVKRGEIRYFEDVVHSLEAAPEALKGVLQGRNKGKMLVRLSDQAF